MDKSHQQYTDKSESGGRYYLLFWGMIFFFMILGVRLWYLQVVRGDEYRGKSESNRTETVELLPVRGLVTDRDGLVLLDNKPSFDLCVQKSEVKDQEVLLTELALILGRPLAELKKKYEKLPRGRRIPQTYITGLSREQLVALESRRFRLEGLSVQVTPRRQPINGVLASHTLGYLGEINKGRLEGERRRIEDGIRQLVREGETREVALAQMESEVKPHKAGDLVGQSGVEQSLEIQLQGRRGQVLREVDSRGRVLRELDVINPEPGRNVRLTLDSRLQALGQVLLGERAGAIVALDPRNFEILALASSPTFNLNDFAGGISTERWQSLRNDSFHPMENRAVSGQYPPGSTFKMVVAMAALAEEVVTPATSFRCTGSLKLGNHTFGCHNRFGHGDVDLNKALKYSCDVYFYEVARKMGVDRLAKRSREFFALGQKPGVELLAEQSGLIPDTAWKMRRFQQKWAPGETLPVSIGQGYVLCSPLQVAMFTGVVANGGRLYRPHLVKEIIDVDGQIVKSAEPELISTIDLPPEQIEAVRRGLVAVVEEQGGTGRRAALPGITVAGKSGTSQVVSLKRYQGYSRDSLPYKYRDHAWFTAYAPADKPEVVVTVLLEHTGGGGAFAAPIARQMLAAYFDKTIVPGPLPPPQVQPDAPIGWGLLETNQ